MYPVSPAHLLYGLVADPERYAEARHHLQQRWLIADNVADMICLLIYIIMHSAAKIVLFRLYCQSPKVGIFLAPVVRHPLLPFHHCRRIMPHCGYFVRKGAPVILQP